MSELSPVPLLDALSPPPPAGPVDPAEPAPLVDPVPPVDPVDSPVNDVVSSRISEVQSFVDAMAGNAFGLLAALGGYYHGITQIYVPDIPVSNLEVPVAGDPPPDPNITTDFPDEPNEPAVANVVIFEPGEAPIFDVTSPVLIDVAVPDPLDALIPQKPDLSVIAIPVEPGFVLPNVPTLASLNIPDRIVLDIPVFDETIGAAPIAPNIEVQWSETAYASELLTAANSRLVEFVNGASTGLVAEVEQAIYDRARDREALLVMRAIDEATEQQAAKGWPIPGGTEIRLIQQAVQESLARETTLSREIMVEQAKLEQSNFQFAFKTAIDLENVLIKHYNDVQQRALEALKLSVDAVLRVFAAKVQLYQADVQAFGMLAQVFETRLKAALARLEIYKSELEAQRLISDINTQQVALYNAQIDGVGKIVDIWRTRVEAVKTQVAIDGLKIEMYSKEIMGYDSLVKAKASEYEGFATQIKAQALRVDAYAAQAGAHRSVVEGYKALTDAKISTNTLNFKQQHEFPQERYRIQADVFKTMVMAEAERVKADVTVFAAKVDGFSATEKSKAELAGAGAEVVKARTSAYTAKAQLSVTASEAELRAAVSSHETVQASARAAAQVAGQMVSAGMAAINVSASMSQSSSHGTSNVSSNSSSNSSSNTSSTSAQNSASNSSSNAAQTSHSNSRGTSHTNSFGQNKNQSWDQTKSTPTNSTTHNYNYDT